MSTRTLLVVRHADAVHDEYIPGDIARHLTNEGYDETVQAANQLKKRKVTPDLIVSSPAIRAFSTALVLANETGFPMQNLVLSPFIYEASAQKILRVIEGLPQKANTVMICGHNPGMHELVNHLCGPVISRFKTAAIAVIRWEGDDWKTPDQGKAKLMEMIQP